MIEEYTYQGKGYNPFLIRQDWQVAQLNHNTLGGLDDIEKIDIHFETDEAFILIKGDVVLITAEKEGVHVTFHTKKMEPNIVYNIPKLTWHNIAMSKDAQVFIVEAANTHLGDFNFYYLNEEQKQVLYTQITNEV